VLAFATAHTLDVLVHDLVPSLGAPLPQLEQLVIGVLIMTAALFIAVAVLPIRADPSINRYTHS
jgi:hypothetical protein